MNIVVHVPKDQLDHFYEDDSEAIEEFWSLKFRPKKLSSGETIYFYNKGKIIGEAIVTRIEETDQECFITGQIWSNCQIYWLVETFKYLDQDISINLTRGFCYI